MNPAKLNHRIRFAQLSSTTDQYGGNTATESPVVVTDTGSDTTWGGLEPIRQYQQAGLEAYASVLNESKILTIRFRSFFTPTKDMIFEDLNTPGDIYTIHSILPYWPGAKVTFQNLDDKVYKDRNFVFILGVKRS